MKPRLRFGVRTFLIAVALVAVGLYALLPTIQATSMVHSFENKSDNYKLDWLEPNLRNCIHTATRDMELESGNSSNYDPQLQSMSFGDLLFCRRRIVLEHFGDWNYNPADSKNKLLRQFNCQPDMKDIKRIAIVQYPSHRIVRVVSIDQLLQTH